MTAMREEVKHWWNNNFLSILMVLMLGSYFAYDLLEKQSNRDEHREMQKALMEHDQKIRTITLVLINNPNTDNYNRELLMNFLRERTRKGE